MVFKVCPLDDCTFQATTNKVLLSHLRHHRKSDFNTRLRCKIEDCGFKSVSYHGYRMHLHRKHSESLNSTQPSQAVIESADQVEDAPVIITETISTERTQVSSTSVLQELCKIYIECRERHLLPITVVHSIFEKLVNFFDDYLALFLEQEGLPQRFHSDIPSLMELWINLKKESCYHEFCQSIGLVEPKMVTLSSDSNDFYFYVPLLESLQAYMSHIDVLNSVFKTQTDIFEPDVLHSYTDGDIFGNNPFFKGDRRLLRLHLYCDEVETSNPIGSSRTIHKLLCFYFILGNIETHYWSSLRNIQLLLVAKSSLVKKYGYAALLSKAAEDISVLESTGIDVKLPDGDTKRFYGSVATISADSLGSHDLGGFRRCFSSGLICRFCMCSYSELKEKCDESNFDLRTKMQHDVHVKAVESNPDLSAMYGVRASPPFKNVLAFHVIKCLPSDVMHDILEGIIPIVIRCVVKDLIRVGKLKKNQLQELFQKFSFGKNDKKSKPTANFKETHICGTASQNWCVFRVLPFVIGDLIPENFPVWQVYLLLAQICDIAFAPSLHVDKINMLDQLVGEFYALFVEVCPENPTPKFHFLLHYARQIKNFGPLRNLWCMRFEANHQRIKKIVRHSHNFKNVPRTVAMRMQFLKCWEQCGETCLVADPQSMEGKEIFVSSLCDDIQKLLSSYNVGQHETVVSVSKLQHNVANYEIGDLHMCGFSDGQPEFFQVKHILQYHKQYFLCGTMLIAQQFCVHYHSYLVEDLLVWVLLKPGDELTRHALDVYNVGDKAFVRLRYSIPGL